MPDSKLVEKLGQLFATICEGGPKNCTCKFQKYLGEEPPCVTCRFKAAEKELRNLSLELSERLRELEDAALPIEARLYNAGTYGFTPGEKRALTNALAERLAEKEKKA